MLEQKEEDFDQNPLSANTLFYQASPFNLTQARDPALDTQTTLELSKTSMRAPAQQELRPYSELSEQDLEDHRLSIKIDFTQIEDYTRENGSFEALNPQLE